MISECDGGVRKVDGPTSIRSGLDGGSVGAQGEYAKSAVRAGSEREVMSYCVVSQLEK